MTYIICPSKIEIYDEETQSLCATVTAEDEMVAKVLMDEPVTAESWRELSAVIEKAINMLELQK